MARKWFLSIALIVTIFVTACGATTTSETPNVESTEVTTFVPTVEPTVTPTPFVFAKAPYYTGNLEYYEGKYVYIVSTEVKDGLYKVTLETTHGIKFDYMEESEVTIYQKDVLDGFTYGSGRWYDYSESTDLENDIIKLTGQLFTYDIQYISPNQTASVYFYQNYRPTEKDLKLKLLLDKQFKDNAIRFPVDGIEDLIRSYNEWGTKDGLRDFLKVIGYPTTVSGYYKMFHSDYTPSFRTGNNYNEEVEGTEKYFASIQTMLDISILGKSQYNVGKFAAILYRNDLLPDVFTNAIKEFPDGKIMKNDSVWEFIKFDDSYGFNKGTVIVLDNDPEYHTTIIPTGYTLVLLDKTVIDTCECWRPLIDYRIFAAYR